MIPIKGGIADKLGVKFSGNSDVQELEDREAARKHGRAFPADFAQVTIDPAKYCDKSLSGEKDGDK
jgi:hypothetical protein